MNCKKCNAELEEGMKFCPSCGADQAAEESKAGLGAGKIALLVVLAIAAVAVVIALVMGGKGGTTPAGTTAPSTPAATGTATEPSVAMTVPADGNPDDVTCKGSYTVADADMEKLSDKVVATMGDAQLTNAELQIFYWMQVYDFLGQYGSYASMFGLDYTQPMDAQLSIDGSLTWQQYFLDSALENWVNYQAMCHEANANGYVLDQEYLDYLEKLPYSMAQSAEEMGYESAEAMLRRDMGAGATVDGYLNYLSTYYLGYMYYGDTMEQIPVTDEEIEAYFDKHAEEYQSNGLEKSDERYVDVRHILICPEGGTTGESGQTTYSDEEWAAAKTKADDLLNQWLAGEASEESFSALAVEKSEDPGSASNGGLYEDVYVGKMVPQFEDWCFDESRQHGDYGIVQTTYGYHIMYFVGSDLVWRLTAESDLMTEKGNELVEGIRAKHPAQIDYSAIALSNVNLEAEG